MPYDFVLMLTALPIWNQGLSRFRNSLSGNLPCAELTTQYVPSSKQQELLLPGLSHSCLARALGKMCSSTIDPGSSCERICPEAVDTHEKGARSIARQTDAAAPAEGEAGRSSWLRDSVSKSKAWSKHASDYCLFQFGDGQNNTALT